MKTLFIILTVTVAVSYGWGMRGMIIGGERGAVLPGALLGMLLALFSGSKVIADNFYFFAAAGAIGMAYGGFEPYAQTMGFILHHNKPDYNPRQGYWGLILKGALWFGICGSVLGMSFSALSGKYYKPLSLIIFIAFIPVMQAVGIKLFNKPLNAKEKIFPKHYYSLTSREEWGGNLVTLICLLAFTLIHRDFYAVLFSLTGIISGAVGWSIGIFLYDFVNHPMKNGKYFFGKFNEWIDGWKIMEYTLGAFTGLGFTVFFLITKNNMLAQRINLIEANGFYSIFNKKNSLIFSLIAVVLILLTAVQYIKTKAIKSIPFRFFEVTERAIFFVLPLIGVMLGNLKMAELVSFFMIVYFGAEKVIFERSENISGTRKVVTNSVFAIISIATLVIQIFTQINPLIYMIMYTLYYIYAENSTAHKKDYDKSKITVNTYFILQTIYLIVATVCI